MKRASLRALIAIVVLAAVAAGAQAKTFSGTVPDVPTGARIHRPLIATVANLPYDGGSVLHTNRTHVIFWQPSGSGLSFDPGYQSLIERFLSDVAADSHKTTNVYSLTGQYRDPAGPAVYASMFGVSVVDTDPLPGNQCTEPSTGPGWSVCLTDAQLKGEIDHMVASAHLPATPHDIYFLVTPNGFGSCTDSTSTSCALAGQPNGYCGYHSQTTAGLLYAVIPYNAVEDHCQSGNPRPNASTADPTLSSLSHEHNEVITDPLSDAWIDGAGNEDGDLCFTSYGPTLGGSGPWIWDEAIHGDHFFLQKEWSNANGSCRARARPDSISFRLLHRAVRGRKTVFLAHAHDPEGRIVFYQWFFGDHTPGHGREVTHRFKQAGTYNVVLRVTDSWGNWAFFSRTVKVAPR